MSVVSSGITSTGIRPRAQVGTLQPAIQCATSTGEHAADDARRGSRYRVVAARLHVRWRPHDEARGDAGPVGDGVGDVAGQRGHEEA